MGYAMANDLEPGFLGGPLQTDETLPVRAYRRIRHAMFLGDLKPGQPVSEPQLSRELGISRAALRESLVRLETEGYVVRAASGRWQVASMTLEDTKEIYQCRGVLEGLAAELAAMHATETDRRTMAAALATSRERFEADDLDGAVLESTRFHDSLVAASGNKRLVSLLNMLRPQLFQNRLLMLKHRTRQPDFLRQNQALLDAIMAGEHEEARALALQSAMDDLEAIKVLYEQGILKTSGSESLLTRK